MRKHPGDLVHLSAQVIFDKKGSNIIGIDVTDISTLTDYILIAEGNVDRHVIAIAKEIEESLLQFGVKPAHIEGLHNGDWVVLDYVHLVIHLFMPGMRQKYQLERLWSKGNIIDLQIDVASSKSIG